MTINWNHTSGPMHDIIAGKPWTPAMRALAANAGHVEVDDDAAEAAQERAMHEPERRNR